MQLLLNYVITFDNNPEIRKSSNFLLKLLTILLTLLQINLYFVDTLRNFTVKNTNENDIFFAEKNICLL